MGIDYPPIRNFTDACAEAWAMRQRFRHVHAALFLDGEGNVIDGIALTSKSRHTHQDVVDYATVTVHSKRVEQILFISSAKDPTDISERDLELFRKTRDEFAGLGVDVVDRINVSPDMVRSFALTAGIDSWSELGPLGACVYPE